MHQLEKTIGRYEVIRPIGRGGMASVHLARQVDLDRFVALKELAGFHAGDPAFARRFLREAQLAGSLSHPNVVTVYDYFVEDGSPYIAMEYLARGSLRAHMGRMTPAQIGGVLQGIMAGLAHAERHGVVHRDLKPENVLVTDEGTVKVADFGIAKATTAVRTGEQLTDTGTAVGTPAYMAPEQAMAQPVGPWTDLYALGCLTYEMFVGELPFAGVDSPLALVLRKISEPHVPARVAEPTVDREISAWIDQLLAKRPDDRPKSVGEAWEVLEELLEASLGPRWARDAALGEPDEPSHGEVPGPYTPPPPDLPQASLASLIGQEPPSMPPPDDLTYVTYREPPSPRPPTASTPPVAPEHPSREEEHDAPAPAPAGSPETPVPTPVPASAALASTIVPRRDDAIAEPEEARSRREPARPRRRRGHLRAGIALVALAAASIAGALLLISHDDAARAVAGPHGVSIGDGRLRAEAPRGFAAIDAGTVRLPGVNVDAAARRGKTTILVGFASRSADVPSLVPSALTQRLGQDTTWMSGRSVARLGQAAAYRYAGLRPQGLGAEVMLFTAPTSAGVATLACLAPAGEAGVATACDQTARASALHGATGFDLGPNRSYARVVDGVIRGVTRARAGAAHAHSAKAQARASAVVASSFARASRTLAGLREISPADRSVNARLASSLGAAATAFQALGEAAHSRSPHAFGVSRTRAQQRERRVRHVLAELRGYGYAAFLRERFVALAWPSLSLPGDSPRHPASQPSASAPSPRAPSSAAEVPIRSAPTAAAQPAPASRPVAKQKQTPATAPFGGVEG